jgi:hypothetical protein
MSAYTMTLKEVLETFTYQDATSLNDQIEKGRQAIFNFDYPIFDEQYRKIFETHFIRQFYMREIGFETEERFLFELESWLNLHMPYYNKLFESELIEFDPLSNTKLDVTHNRQNDTNQSSTANGTSNNSGTSENQSNQTSDNFNRQLESNNPDSRLSITTNDGEGVIEYASQIEENTQNNKLNADGSTSVRSQTDDTQTVKNDVNSIEDYIENRSGKVGSQSFSSMLKEYRSSMIRVEKTIFEEMQPLFMLVY